jgi:hypothetical protein
LQNPHSGFADFGGHQYLSAVPDLDFGDVATGFAIGGGNTSRPQTQELLGWDNFLGDRGTAPEDAENFAQFAIAEMAADQGVVIPRAEDSGQPSAAPWSNLNLAPAVNQRQSYSAFGTGFTGFPDNYHNYHPMPTTQALGFDAGTMPAITMNNHSGWDNGSQFESMDSQQPSPNPAIYEANDPAMEYFLGQTGQKHVYNTYESSANEQAFFHPNELPNSVYLDPDLAM